MWPFMEAERRGPSAGGTGHFHWQVVAFNKYDKVREIFVDSLTVPAALVNFDFDDLQGICNLGARAS